MYINIKKKQFQLFLILIYIFFSFLLFLTLYKLNLFEFNSSLNFQKKYYHIKILVNDNKNLFSIIFFLFSTLWITCLGLGFPMMILSVFLFDIFLSIFLITFSFIMGSSILFIISKFFFKDILKIFNFNKYKKYIFFIKKNEMYYYFVLRLIPGIPSPLKNILPAIANIKFKNFFIPLTIVEIPTIILNLWIIDSLTKGFIYFDTYFGDKITYAKILLPLLIVVILMIFKNKIKKKYFK